MRYRHFKGSIYEVVCEATHTETLEKMVVYRDVNNGSTWIRPARMFYGYTGDGTRRFAPIKDEVME